MKLQPLSTKQVLYMSVGGLLGHPKCVSQIKCLVDLLSNFNEMFKLLVTF